MDKEKLVTKVIFGSEDLSKVSFPVNKESKLNFEIAWDVWDNFEKIMKGIRKYITNKIVDKIKNSEEFKNYEFRDKDKGFKEGKKWSPFLIFKRNWVVNTESEPVLSYAVEFDKESYLGSFYFGIRKKDNDNGIPFKGKWTNNKDIPESWSTIFLKIDNKLKESNSGWKVSEWWIFLKNFDSHYGNKGEKEFYLEILEKGYDAVAEHYLEEIISLKKQTEDLIDEFIEDYRNKNKI